MAHDEFPDGSIGHLRNGWDWKRLLPTSTWHKILLDGLPGWDLNKDGNQLQVLCAFTMGEGLSSRDIAIDWDGRSRGLFYYRDHTNNGIPFVDDGIVYVSSFAFQFMSDLLLFGDAYEKYTEFGEALFKIQAFEQAVYKRITTTEGAYHKILKGVYRTQYDNLWLAVSEMREAMQEYGIEIEPEQYLNPVHTVDLARHHFAALKAEENEEKEDG